MTVLSSSGNEEDRCSLTEGPVGRPRCGALRGAVPRRDHRGPGTRLGPEPFARSCVPLASKETPGAWTRRGIGVLPAARRRTW